jgi:H+-transporting ATPase
VKALQERNHIVGMTGDGVNDAPALKRADAGIAVAGATDAARAAADIVFLAPGLSMIVEAVIRAREVFRRMKNYAIYRLAETIRVVFAVTAVILLFAFFPVTPIQIVLLAILNDGAMLSIAYDRVRPSDRPERWVLRDVLIVAAVIGGLGIVSTTLIIWVAQGPLGLSQAMTQTLVYLKLSVAGHLTLFVARTRGRMWSYRPSWILLTAVIGTQILATAIAAFGFLMQPLPLEWVGLAWGYAAVWALILDQAKLLAYRVLEGRPAQEAVVPT